MRARWQALALVAATALIATGCSSSQEASEPSAADCGEGFCIGLVLDGGVIDDGAFHAAAWQGVQAAAESAGGTAEYLGSEDADAYAANIAAFAERGFDVIVTTFVALPEVTVDAAAAYPDSRFIGVSQDMSGATPNAIGLVFSDDKAGYAAGYLAGLMTQTGTVGAVLGSEEVIPLKRFGEGYRLGALAARPDATVIMDYSTAADSFNDPDWAAATTTEQLAAGADLVFGAGGTTGTSALLTVAAAPGAGESVYCIGIDIDQYFTVPDARPCLLTSAEKKIAEGVEAIIADIVAGSAPSGNVQGSVGLAPYHDLESRVPAEVQQQVLEVIAGLDAGSISTGVDF
ncbi:MAG: BMP family ABC transporter substrate-binding protein [Candidatus Nanopelagicales bacterium]